MNKYAARDARYYQANKARRNALHQINRLANPEREHSYYVNTHPNYGLGKNHGLGRLFTRVERLELKLLKEFTPCMDCHNYFPPERMHFHHRTGEVKVGCVPHLHGKQQRAEMAKCDLLCATCHRLRHLHQEAA